VPPEFTVMDERSAGEALAEAAGRSSTPPGRNGNPIVFVPAARRIHSGRLPDPTGIARPPREARLAEALAIVARMPPRSALSS
jgi:hypothetical protein